MTKEINLSEVKVGQKLTLIEETKDYSFTGEVFIKDGRLYCGQKNNDETIGYVLDKIYRWTKILLHA